MTKQETVTKLFDELHLLRNVKESGIFKEEDILLTITYSKENKVTIEQFTEFMNKNPNCQILKVYEGNKWFFLKPDAVIERIRGVDYGHRGVVIKHNGYYLMDSGY